MKAVALFGLMLVVSSGTWATSAEDVMKELVPAKSVDEAMAMMTAGTAQAFALTHDALPTLQKQLPGSRILDGSFQTTGVAVAVQKDHPAALAYVTNFIKSAKADGTVRRAFDDAGLNALPIAPPSP